MRIILKPAAAQPTASTTNSENQNQSSPAPAPISTAPTPSSQPQPPIVSVVEADHPKINYYSAAESDNSRDSAPEKSVSHTNEKEPQDSSAKRLRGTPPARQPAPAVLAKDSEKSVSNVTANPASAAQAELALLHELKKKGFVIKPMSPDGNCLFRSIAHQVYGDPEMHDIVRKNCLDYVEHEKEHFSQFVTEDINDYITRKRRPNVYGNNVEIQACAEIYNRPIEVYSGVTGDKPLNIFQDQYKTENFPIRLSYHNGNHYNSVLDPNNPSVGVGLGMPNLQPGLADKTLMAEAIKVSEETDIENALVNTLKKETEAQLTEKEIEDAILQASLKESAAQAPPVAPRILRRGDEDEDVDIEAAIAASLADFTAQQLLKHQAKK